MCRAGRHRLHLRPTRITARREIFTARQLLTDEILAQVGTVARERTGLVTAGGIARYCSGILDERFAHIDRSAAPRAGISRQDYRIWIIIFPRKNS